MPGTIDLHTHTTASDGSLTPRALIRLAAERGLKLIAVTDHDTTLGTADAQDEGRTVGVDVITGVELNCDLPDGHADILGYCFDIAAPALQTLLLEIRDARDGRARRMVDQLRAIGADIEYDDVLAIAGDGSVGRPHVAQALVAKGFVPDVSTAFERFIGRHGPAYADRYRLTPEAACRAIRAAGGVPSLAHPVPPSDPRSDPKSLRTFLPPLVEAGLGGLECYYSGYTTGTSSWLLALARHFGLIPTGGSDYHGPWRADRELGGVDVPDATVDALRRAAAAG